MQGMNYKIFDEIYYKVSTIFIKKINVIMWLWVFC